MGEPGRDGRQDIQEVVVAHGGGAAGPVERIGGRDAGAEDGVDEGGADGVVEEGDAEVELVGVGDVDQFSEDEGDPDEGDGYGETGDSEWLVCCRAEE